MSKFAVWDTQPLPLQRQVRFCSIEDRMKRAAEEDQKQSSREGRITLEDCGPRACLVDTFQTSIDGNGFLQALDVAYNYHQTLSLRPDDIWLVITMAFSAHINNDPEKYRDLLVKFEGKKDIIVYSSLTPGSGTNNFMADGVFENFSDQIKQHIGEDLHGQLVADFSTTTPLDKAVSQIVLMDTMKAFFNFQMEGLCGIPNIILEGTVEDWESVRKRVETFAPFDLNWWLEDLRYVLDQFVAASRGDIDVAFWQRMYRGWLQDDGYPWERATHVSGWVHVFFPYTKAGWPNTVRMCPAAFHRRNSNGYMDTGRQCCGCGSSGSGAEGRGEWWCQTCWRAHDIRRFYRHEVEHMDLPVGLRKVPFIWNSSNVDFSCDFLAGFPGCAVESDDVVKPQVAYCVVNHGPEKTRCA